MRSTLNGPLSYQTDFNDAGAMPMMASSDGREMASATSFAKVGVVFNDSTKPYFTCNSNNCTRATRESHGSQHAHGSKHSLPTCCSRLSALVLAATRPGVAGKTIEEDGRRHNFFFWLIRVDNQYGGNTPPPRRKGAQGRAHHTTPCDGYRIRRFFRQERPEVLRSLPRRLLSQGSQHSHSLN